MIRKLLKWAAVSVVALIVLVFGILAFTGVPKPPTVTAEGVGRVGWKPILDNLGQLRKALRSKSLGSWMPNGEGFLARGTHNVIDFRLHTVRGPGGKLEFLPQIPRNVSGTHVDVGRSYIIFRWDTDGNEQYQLYRWDLGSADPLLLTSGEERATFGAYEPEGPRMAYVSTRRNGADYDIYVMNPLNPESERLVLEREGPWGVWDWSPIAGELLLARTVSNLENEIYRFDLSTGILTLVSDTAGGPVGHSSVQYSRDGMALYYTSDRDTEFRHLRRLNLGSGEETTLTADVPWDVTSVQQSGDGTFLIFGVNEDGRTRYYFHETATDSRTPLDLIPTGLYSVGLHPEDPILVVNHTDLLGVSRGYVYDLETEELTLWVGPEPESTSVPDPRLVRYPTFDSVNGKPRQISAFVYPGVGEGPRPVLISIHGGPESQSRLSTGQSIVQEEGITLITPNVRGSTGYGKTFTSLDNGFLRENSVKDIGALLDWVQRQPDMDGERIMVTGGSYGGYMVLASLVHFGGRIRCGVDIVGISNFVTFLENTADYRRDLRRPEYGDERDPEMRAFLESISPLNHVDRIQSRIMIVQGANDPRVPVTESRQFVEGLRANGLEVAYIEGANEGHGFRNPWNAIYAGVAEVEMARECLLESAER